MELLSAISRGTLTNTVHHDGSNNGQHSCPYHCCLLEGKGIFCRTLGSSLEHSCCFPKRFKAGQAVLEEWGVFLQLCAVWNFRVLQEFDGIP